MREREAAALAGRVATEGVRGEAARRAGRERARDRRAAAMVMGGRCEEKTGRVDP